jgi:hypothetical protein
MKLISLKLAYKSNSFDVSIGIKILFFRVSVTIELGSFLLTVCYHKLFDDLLHTVCLIMPTAICAPPRQGVVNVSPSGCLTTELINV